jgi:hypothetical protein
MFSNFGEYFLKYVHIRKMLKFWVFKKRRKKRKETVEKKRNEKRKTYYLMLGRGLASNLAGTGVCGVLLLPTCSAARSPLPRSPQSIPSTTGRRWMVRRVPAVARDGCGGQGVEESPGTWLRGSRGERPTGLVVGGIPAVEPLDISETQCLSRSRPWGNKSDHAHRHYLSHFEKFRSRYRIKKLSLMLVLLVNLTTRYFSRFIIGDKSLGRYYVCMRHAIYFPHIMQFLYSGWELDFDSGRCGLCKFLVWIFPIKILSDWTQ